MKNNWTNFWFAVARQGEGEGGGAGGEGGMGLPTGEGGDTTAGADAPASPTTFMSAPAAAAAAAPAEGEAPAGEASAEPTEPVVAELFDATKLTLPEGVTLPEEAATALTALLNNPELSAQERGQQLTELYGKSIAEVATNLQTQMQEAGAAAWTQMNDGWRAEIAALPEYKNDPDGEAGKVYQALTSVGADKEFFAALDLTGAGNHPAIAQVLHRLAQPFIEGSAVGGGQKPLSSKRLGDNIYTSTNKG